MRQYHLHWIINYPNGDEVDFDTEPMDLGDSLAYIGGILKGTKATSLVITIVTKETES